MLSNPDEHVISLTALHYFMLSEISYQ